MGELPPRRLRLGDRLEGAVEAIPRRRPGQLAAGAEVHDGVDDHALPRGAVARRWPGAPTAASARRARQAWPGATTSRWRPDQPGEDRGDGEDEVGAVASGPARRARRRASRASSLGPTGRPYVERTANTAHHSVRARPPFHAIAVSPIGVST